MTPLDYHSISASLRRCENPAIDDLEIIRERFTAIVQGSDDAIYSKDTRAICDSWNAGAERLYGYTPAEAIGRHISFIVPDDRKGEEMDILERILAGERVDHYETQRVTKSGAIVDVSLTVSPVRDQAGRIVGASVIGRDISERRRLEELQRRVDRNEFIARTVHELRNPVATLAGFTYLLSEEPDISEERRAEALQAIARQAGVLQTLTRDLLDLAYVESGRYEMRDERVDVARAVSRALADNPVPEGKIVEVDVAEGAAARADAVRVGQILANLLGNAYNYGGDRILVRARGEAGVVTIEVADNGAGIPELIRTTLFEPFVRGHAASRGSGLGLSIVARLAEAQHGEVTLDPSQPGARFIVRLPAAG